MGVRLEFPGGRAARIPPDRRAGKFESDPNFPDHDARPPAAADKTRETQ